LYNLTLLAADAGSWWEPGTPNSLDVGDVSAILGLIALACGMLFTISKIWMKLLRTIIREEIVEATAPIHPAEDRTAEHRNQGFDYQSPIPSGNNPRHRTFGPKAISVPL